MISKDNVSDDFTKVNENFEYDVKIKKINEELRRCLHDYRKSIEFMLADAPLGILCLPKTTEKVLLDNGCLRVYDMLNVDFTKIEGLTDIALSGLTTRLNQFLSML